MGHIVCIVNDGGLPLPLTVDSHDMYTYTYYVTHTVLIHDIVNDGGLPLPLTVDSHDMYTYTYYVSHTVIKR
jgi:D-ribose pyranose/furanose isomerase RbsD